MPTTTTTPIPSTENDATLSSSSSLEATSYRTLTDHKEVQRVVEVFEKAFQDIQVEYQQFAGKTEEMTDYKQHMKASVYNVRH